MFLHETKQILRKFLLLRPRSPDNFKNDFFYVVILATTPCRCRAQCIPMCSYCIYYCSLPSSSASSLCKVPIDDKYSSSCCIYFRTRKYHRLSKQTVWILNLLNYLSQLHHQPGTDSFGEGLPQNH